MQTVQLDEGLSVATQIVPADVAGLAARGFRSIINNRPDGEVEGQPADAALAAAASRCGLAYRHIPVVSGCVTEGQIREFAQALAQLPAPVLAFCRSGARSTTVWALAAARNRSVDEVLDRATVAGYDLGAWRAQLEAMAGTAARGSVA